MQNIVNADLSHEYGSCESQRSVINTPSGIFYISQAQGKIFQYSGEGLNNIANAKAKVEIEKITKEDWEEIIKMGNAEKFEIKFKN
jgi:hypothetical protein